MVTPLTFPALVQRLVKGAELTFAEGDQNLTNIQAFCTELANLIANSLNPDGTLVSGSVGAPAIQPGSVGIAAINPAALYSLIPLGTDKGAVNAYAISTLGPQPGNNLILSAPSYDSNGNYTLNGLTQNSSYVWTKNANDLSLVVDENTTLSASGIFQATQTSAVLKGSPGALVTATVFQAAAVTSYQDGQLYFIYTQNANTGASTLNVNGLGAIPVLSSNAPLTAGMIGAGSVFCVIYENGVFILFSGSGTTASGSAGASTATNYTFEGTTKFNSGYLAVPANSGAGGTLTVVHGLQQVPDSVQVALIKVAADSTSVPIGETVLASMFTIGGGMAFSTSWDSATITVTEIAGAGPNLFGTNITPASWVLVVTATKQSNVNNLVFPALTYSLSNPEGAFSYGTNLISFNYTGSKTLNNVVDMTTSLITSLSAASPGGTYPQVINGSLFTRASGEIDFVFCATTGVYAVPAVNPLTSIVPPYVTYNNSGIYDLTVVPGTVYNWSVGSNDTSYSLDGGVTFITTASFTGPAGGMVVLKGTANGSVTASVLVASATWGAVRTGLATNLTPIISPFVTVAGLYAYSLYFNYKPVWIVDTGSITDCYAVVSSALTGSFATGFSASASAIAASTTPYTGSALNAVPMIHITGSGISNVGTAFDFTNAAINGVSTGDYAAWYAAGDNPNVLLFQYNPISKRIYIVTNRIGCIHIFQITGGSYGSGGNDISAFWADTGGRYANTSYIKSVMLAGDGALWGNTNRGHMTIEWDMTSGAEKAVVFTREGGTTTTGSVTRIPWTE